MLKFHLGFKCTLIAIICAIGVFGQDIYTECELDFTFEYFPYDVEDPELGIAMFNTYSAVLNETPKLRRNSQNHVLSGKHTDFFKGGSKMHVGRYEDGRLLEFKNYYNNGKTERELKLKKSIPVNYKSFYPNESMRELKEFKNGILLKHEQYFENENLKYGKYFNHLGIMDREESLTEQGVILNRIQLNPGTADIYTITNKNNDGLDIDSGRYRFNPSTNKFVKHGTYTKFNESGETILEVVYKNGGVLKTVQEEDLRSSIPARFIAFDKDNDGQISQKEIIFVVNDFFDGENNISLDKINDLVNYFFEQD